MNALVRIPGIRVASRTSAFRARRDGDDLSAIARALSVGHILEGSVRTAGSRLRVTAQLTDVASGYQLWSERFDRESADVFAVQDEITVGVVEAVKARLAPGEHAIRPRPQPANLEAYRSYLMGRHFRGKEHHVAALRAFEEAVRLDPSHAPSWTGLAEVTVLASVFGLIPAREACATARTALATAARLQGDSAEGLHVEAFAAWIERRWAAMENAWRRAIALEPNHVLALASFGIVLCTRQRLDEALPLFERARQADPLASFPYTYRRRLAQLRPARGSPALPRRCALLREGGRHRSGQFGHGPGCPGPFRGRHRTARARGCGVAPRAALPRHAGLGARRRGPEGRGEDDPRGAARPAGGVARRRVRGMAARRARGGRSSLRGDRARRKGVPGLPLLHRGVPPSIRFAATRDSGRCWRGWSCPANRAPACLSGRHTKVGDTPRPSPRPAAVL